MTFHNSIIMAMKYSTRKLIEENKKLKQEVRKLRESVAILLQDVTCAKIKLTENQARLDAMDDRLNLCIKERAQDSSQI